MKNLFLVFFLFVGANLFAQSVTSLSGRLLDQEANLEPLTFAKVVIKETNTKVMTDENGNFTFKNIAPGHYTIVCSFSGYETKVIETEVKKSNENFIDLNLSATTLSLDDLMSVVSSNTSASIKH